MRVPKLRETRKSEAEGRAPLWQGCQDAEEIGPAEILKKPFEHRVAGFLRWQENEADADLYLPGG